LTSFGRFCIILTDESGLKGFFLNLSFSLISILMNKLTSYIRESIAEMKKVTWPTKKETYNYTLLVIGISIGTAIFLGILDYIFTTGFQFFINK